MAEKGEMRKTRSRTAWVCIGVGALMGLIGVVALVVFLVWLIVPPHGPRFVLQDVTIYNFNISQSHLLSSNLQVTLSARNPNDKSGISYDRLKIYASYRNEEVTLQTALPPGYQGHLEDILWSPVLIGSDVPMTSYLSSQLDKDLIAGMVLLNIKIDGRVRYKEGSRFPRHYRLHVNCPAYITFPGPVFTYQLVQNCVVDI